MTPACPRGPTAGLAVARPIAVVMLAVASAAWPSARAAERTWTVTTGTWADGTSWAGGTAPADSTTTDTAFFSGTSANVVASVNANRLIAGITFGAAGTTTINNTSGGNRALTVGTSGITLNAGAGAVIIGSTAANQWVRIILSGSQTWTNNSSNTFTLNNRLRIGAGNGVTLKGSGDWSIAAVENSNGLATGTSGPMVVDIGGKATLAANAFWTGGMTITSGTVAYTANDALGTASNTITIENGWLEATSVTAAQRNLAATMVWKGSVGFGGANTLSATTTAVTLAANSNVTTTGGAVTIGSSTTALGESGGSFGFTKLGSGTLILDGATTYSGTTRINDGTLRLGTGGSFANSPFVAVGGTTGASGAILDLTAKTGTFTFLSTQTVGGVGTINIGSGKTVAVAGTWAPGNSIGSNAVTGNLELSGSSVFELGTPGSSTLAPGNSDFTAVSGTLTLGGTLALLDNANAGGLGSYGAGAYRLFTYGAVSGSYASITPATASTRVGIVVAGSGTAAGQGVFANVYNLASATSSQTVNVGSMYAGSTKTAAVTLTNSAPANATYTETLSSGSFSSTSTDFTASGAASGIAGGSSGTGTLLVGLGSGLSAGAASGTTVLSLFSNAVNSSGFAEQSVGSQTITITGGVYNLASVTTAQAVNLGNVHVGDTATTALTLTNTAPVNPTYTETLGSGGFSSTSAGFTATGSVTGIAGGSSGTGTLLVGFATGSAGARNGSTVLSLNSEAVNSSGLGTNSFANQTITITGTVWNYAAASIASGTTINFGAVLKNTTLSQQLSISNSAPADGFSERLDAAFGSPTGLASGSGSFNLLSAGGTSTAMSVYLGSGSAGLATGSMPVTFTSNGDGTSGLGTTSLPTQTVFLTGTVLDRAVASFTSGTAATTSFLLDFGEVSQNASVSPLGFDLWNLVQTSGYTADLAYLGYVSGTGNTGAITTSLALFNNLAPGTSNSWTASFSTANPGMFVNTYTLEFKSASGGTVFAGDSPQYLTLTVQGVVVVPEPGAVALAVVGVGLAAWRLRRRRDRR